MDIFYNKLEADPSTIGMDVVGGRLDLVSATSIKWGFQNSNQIRLVNPDTGRWELVKCSTEPTIANTALDLNGTALVPNTIYDVFAEYSSATVFNLVLSRWGTGGDGVNNSSTSYATPVMTSNTAHGPYTVLYDTQYDSGSNVSWHAFDQNTSTSWCSTDTSLPHWIGMDFGVGNAVCINKYSMYMTAAQNYSPSTWKFQGSNDNFVSDVTDLDSKTSQTLNASTWYDYTCVNNKNYRYYRIYVTANRSGNITGMCVLKLVAASNSLAGGSSRVRAYESTVTYAIGDRVTYGGHDWVKQSSAAAGTTPVAGDDWVDNGSIRGGDGALNNRTDYATPAMTAATSYGVTASSTSTTSGCDAYYAFNQTLGEVNTVGIWASTAAPTSGSPQSLMIDFGSSGAVCINKYKLRARNSTDADTQAFPKTWTFEGTNSGVIGDASGANGWVVLDTVTTSTSPGQSTWEASYHTFSNNTPYQKYRLRVTDRYGVNNYVCIDELKLVEAQDDFSGLYRHDGVLVSDSSTTGKSRRWLGIIYTYNNSGTVNFKDDVNYRYISNYYNRKSKYIQSNNNGSNYSFTTTSLKESNNGAGSVRGYSISCVTLDATLTLQCAAFNNTLGSTVMISLSQNSSALHNTYIQQAVANYCNMISGTAGATYYGLNYICFMEAVGANTGTVYVAQTLLTSTFMG